MSKISVSTDKTIDKIRDLVDHFRNEGIADLVVELEAEGFEGDLHIQAITILSSACLTFARHVQEVVLNQGGSVNEVAVGDSDQESGSN